MSTINWLKLHVLSCFTSQKAVTSCRRWSMCFCVSVCGAHRDSLACVSCFNLLTCVDLLLPVTASPQLFVFFVFFLSSSCCPSHLLPFITCFFTRVVVHNVTGSVLCMVPSGSLGKSALSHIHKAFIEGLMDSLCNNMAVLVSMY